MVLPRHTHRLDKLSSIRNMTKDTKTCHQLGVDKPYYSNFEVSRRARDVTSARSPPLLKSKFMHVTPHRSSQDSSNSKKRRAS